MESENATWQIPVIKLPASAYLSRAAKDALLASQRRSLDPPAAFLTENIPALREMVAADIARSMVKAEKLLPSHVVRTSIGGVPTTVVTP